MRVVLLIVFGLAACGSALAEVKSSMRIATEAEIRMVLRGTSELKAGKNGWEYRQGSRVGYKISNGQMCVFQSGRQSCFTMYYDGKRLEMMDKRGNREFLN